MHGSFLLYFILYLNLEPFWITYYGMFKWTVILKLILKRSKLIYVVFFLIIKLTTKHFNWKIWIIKNGAKNFRNRQEWTQHQSIQSSVWIWISMKSGDLRCDLVIVEVWKDGFLALLYPNPLMFVFKISHTGEFSNLKTRLILYSQTILYVLK